MNNTSIREKMAIGNNTIDNEVLFRIDMGIRITAVCTWYIIVLTVIGQIVILNNHALVVIYTAFQRNILFIIITIILIFNLCFAAFASILIRTLPQLSADEISILRFKRLICQWIDTTF